MFMSMNEWIGFGMGLLMTVGLQAQEQHFDGWKWKERETDHFALRAESSGYDPASKYAEKVWDVCIEAPPGLIADVEKNEFRTPTGSKGSEEAPFRHTVYLLGNGDDFNRLVEIDAKRNGWGVNTVRITQETANYADPHHRYGVFCKADPKQSAGGDRDMTSVFVHSTASSLLAGRSRSHQLPFWMTAGYGYYVEHRLFDLCRVLYLDFEAYYANQKAEIKRGETLGPDKSWASVLRRMCKKDERVSLDDVCTAQILTLSPKESGYIFALSYFLVRDDDARKKYQQLVAKARDGQAIVNSLLLEVYGYADNAALEKEWYEWMESRDFK